MVASSTHRRSKLAASRRVAAICLLVGLVCGGWSACGKADEWSEHQPTVQSAFDPFETVDKPTFDPFEVRQVSHVEERLEQARPQVRKLPPVTSADPFDNVSWSAPRPALSVPPSDAAMTPPSEPKHAPHSSRRVAQLPRRVVQSSRRVAQLELSTPSEQQNDEGYAEAARDWSPKPLDTLTINISEPAGVTPRDYAADRPQRAWPCDPTLSSRCWPLLTYQWAAPCICYQPLYFEEINVERYGYGCGGCLQSAASAAHFFGTVPILPYCMAVNCPGECNYTLGQYRPGSCAPWRASCPGPNCYGGLAEAGTVVGLVLLIP